MVLTMHESMHGVPSRYDRNVALGIGFGSAYLLYLGYLVTWNVLPLTNILVQYYTTQIHVVYRPTTAWLHPLSGGLVYLITCNKA